MCEKCKQNPASVTLHHNINGKITKYNLCEECAASTMNSISSLADSAANDISSLVFDSVFKNFVNSILNFAGDIKEKEPGGPFKELKCPSCGLTYEGFRSSVKLGCADCYNTFRGQLLSFFKNMQGSASHTGKLPVKGGAQLIKVREADRLRKRLRQHIEAEEFEEAAKIRDKIKELS